MIYLFLEPREKWKTSNFLSIAHVLLEFADQYLFSVSVVLFSEENNHAIKIIIFERIRERIFWENKTPKRRMHFVLR